MWTVKHSACLVSGSLCVCFCCDLTRLGAAILGRVAVYNNNIYANKLHGWQLSGGIATRAARRALPSRQYRLWPVTGKIRACGDASQRSGPRSEGCCAPLRGGEAGSPSNTLSSGPRPTPPYQVVSWSIQPFGHNRHCSKSGESYFNRQKFYGGHSSSVKKAGSVPSLMRDESCHVT